MARKKRGRKARVMNPFSMYMDMFQAGMETAELITSSLQVVAHRGELMSRAINGEIPLHHKEFRDMWQEKFVAANESMLVAMKYMGRATSGSLTIKEVMQTVKPYRVKASANARRLNKAKKS